MTTDVTEPPIGPGAGVIGSRQRHVLPRDASTRRRGGVINEEEFKAQTTCIPIDIDAAVFPRHSIKMLGQKVISFEVTAQNDGYK
jgi:hypothetical protein